MRPRSSGDRIRPTNDSGDDIGPARNVRSLTSQIRRVWAANRSQFAPSPELNPSTAFAVAVGSSGRSSVPPFGQR